MKKLLIVTLISTVVCFIPNAFATNSDANANTRSVFFPAGNVCAPSVNQVAGSTYDPSVLYNHGMVQSFINKLIRCSIPLEPEKYVRSIVVFRELIGTATAGTCSLGISQVFSGGVMLATHVSPMPIVSGDNTGSSNLRVDDYGSFELKTNGKPNSGLKITCYTNTPSGNSTNNYSSGVTIFDTIRIDYDL